LVDVCRGEIWWAALPESSGSEPGYRRPVVILQADSFNHSRIRTVIGVGLTTNLQRAESPGNVLLPSRQTRLPKDCVANVSQLITMNKGDLLEWVGPLPSHLLQRIEGGLRLILNL
jgi:mRNA interferase MazF